MSRQAIRSSTADYRSIDIREFNKWGLLEASGWRTVTWRRGGEIVSSIGVLPCCGHLLLRYSCRALKASGSTNSIRFF